MSQQFKGIFAALTSPFKENQIFPEKLRENIEKYNNFNLAGYVIAGSTGEGVYLSDEECISLVQAAKKSAMPNRKIIVGTARESTKNTLDFTNRVADTGIDAALICVPHYYKSRMDSEALKRHYLSIADKTNIPIIIYSIPPNTGITPEPTLIIELSNHSNILGIKDSSGNLFLLEEAFPKMASGSTFLLGAGSILFTGLTMGATGGIMTLAAVAPELCLRLYNLFLEKKWAEAEKLQLELVPLNQAVTRTFGIPAAKYALDLQGYYGGPCRLPLLPLDTKGQQYIHNTLTNLKMI